MQAHTSLSQHCRQRLLQTSTLPHAGFFAFDLLYRLCLGATIGAMSGTGVDLRSAEAKAFTGAIVGIQVGAG